MQSIFQEKEESSIQFYTVIWYEWPNSQVVQYFTLYSCFLNLCTLVGMCNGIPTTD